MYLMLKTMINETNAHEDALNKMTSRANIRGSKRHRSKTEATLLHTVYSLPGRITLSFALLLPLCVAFNLDVDNPSVYSGPQGSYFGYSVDFYMTSTPG